MRGTNEWGHAASIVQGWTRWRKTNTSCTVTGTVCAMIVHVNDRRELQGCKLDARQTRLDETRPVCRPTLIAGQGFTAGKWREYKYSRGIALAKGMPASSRSRLAFHSSSSPNSLILLGISSQRNANSCGASRSPRTPYNQKGYVYVVPHTGNVVRSCTPIAYTGFLYRRSFI